MNGDGAAPVESRWAAVRVLRIRDFRLLWVGMFLLHALMPTQMVTQVLYIQDSAGEGSRLLLAGVLGAVRGGSMIAFGPIGGAFADRMDRRKLLLVTQSTALCANAAVAAVILMEPGSATLTLSLLFLFTIAASGAMAADIPTRQAMVPQLVGPADLPYAIALQAAAMQVAFPVALPLAGLLIAWVGHGSAYAITLVGHVSLLTALLLMRYRGRPAPSVVGSSLLRNMREGLAYARQHPPVLWTLVLLFCVMGIGMPIPGSFGPVWMTRVLDLSPEGMAAVFSMWGIGAMVASIVMSNVGHFPSKAMMLCACAVVFGLALIMYAHSRSVPITAGANLMLGALMTTTQITALSLVQRLLPNEVQGRVMSLFMLNQGLTQFNAAPLGAFAQLFTLERVFYVAAWGCLIACVAIIATRPEVRRSSRLPAVMSVAADARAAPTRAMAD